MINLLYIIYNNIIEIMSIFVSNNDITNLLVNILDENDSLSISGIVIKWWKKIIRDQKKNKSGS